MGPNGLVLPGPEPNQARGCGASQPARQLQRPPLHTRSCTCAVEFIYGLSLALIVSILYVLAI